MTSSSSLKIIAIVVAVATLIYILSLVQLWTQLFRYKAYWDRNNSSQTTAAVTYVALGDSTAQGIGANKPQNSYVGYIHRELEQREGQPVALYNLSKSGAKIYDVLDVQLSAYEKLQLQGKVYVTIEIGANNMFGFEAATFERQMDELMSRLPRQTAVSDIPYFGESRFKSKQPLVDQANEIMYRLARTHGFVLVPMHERIKTNGGFKVFAPDWFHPSTYSYRENWAYEFLKELKSN